MTDIMIRKVQERRGTIILMNRFPLHRRQIARCALRDVVGIFSETEIQEAPAGERSKQ